MRTVEMLLRPYPSGVQAIAHDARQVIRRLLPDVEEHADASAPVIGYGYGSGYRGMVCTLILSKAGVKLGIVGGASLPDPRRLLQGSGKVHKYVPLQAPADIRRAGVSQLIEAAHASTSASSPSPTPRSTPRAPRDRRHAVPSGKLKSA